MLAGYGSGAVDYLNKPVNPAVLRSKVSIFADLHRKSRELGLANSILKNEIRERLRAEEELRVLNESLERRVAERTEALLRSEQKLQSVMDGITDGFYTLDHDWRFTYCNEQGARLFGMSTGELLGGVIWDLFPKMKTTGFYECYLKAAETRSTVSIEELYSESPAKWFECHCYPSEDGVSVYFHEITERREADALREQLLAAEQAARTEGDRVARAKDEFLTSLSHELRTPLAAILGWAMVLKRPNTDAETWQRGIDAITKNAQAQTQLVSELLDTSRIVSGKLHVELERIDLNAVAAAAVDTLRPSAQAKGISIDVVPSTESSLELMGDAGRLAQIATNLLTNAVKFTPSAGVVTVTTRRVDLHVELIVADTGDGIQEKFLPYLFDRFSQADGSAARLHGGLGLGLSIVKDLVELHSGTIMAQSRGKGLGSSFVVRFPAAPAVRPEEALDMAARGRSTEEAVTSADADRQRSETDLGGVRVLLVDDHGDVLEIERRLLSECGAMVDTATSAEAALHLLKAQTFDVLLSDLGMPGMDGYQLIETIRTSQDQGLARLPAAAITAFVRQEDRQRAFAAGYQAFLRKPVSPTALVMTVAELARKR
jgi:PAS domain S-box-containing protein